MYDYEVAVEFGFTFKYFVVRAASASEAKTEVWNNLDEELKSVVSSMEITDVQEVE